MELALHKVDKSGFVNLSGIAAPDGHYTVHRNDTSGVIRLVPVKVTTTAVNDPMTVTVVDPGEVPWPLPGE